MSKGMIPLACACMMLMGMVGMVVQRHNMIRIILCLELMMLGAQSYGVWLAYAMHMQSVHVLVMALMVIAAAEMAIALAIVIMLYGGCNQMDSDVYTQLKG